MPHGYPHDSLGSTSMQRTTNDQGQVAPPGFHYMPDGTLMSDAEHARLYGSEKIIMGIDLDLSDIPAAGASRNFTINGSNGSIFSLEIKNEDSYYYNFETKAFQAAKSRLEKKQLVNNQYSGTIKFPLVTDDDQYDVYLWAEPGTSHSSYIESRFADGSIDINSSTGSSSLLLQKVIYQYTDLTLTITPFSPNSVTDIIKSSSRVDDTITISRGQSRGKIPFSISCEVNAATKSYKVLKQPFASDFMTFVSPTIGSAPEDLPGEDIYPTVNNTDTVDGEFEAAAGNKFIMDTNVADKMVVGDKITAATSTDTVDGAVSSGVKVVMDNNVGGKMAIGDQITCSSSSLAQDVLFDKQIVTVAAMNPDGDNAKEFSMSTAMAIADGATLTFTPKCNRELWTVTALNPDTDNVKEFSADGPLAGEDGNVLGLIDGVTLSFSNQMNYSWPVNNYVDKIAEKMILHPGTNVTASTITSNYTDSVTLFEGTEDEEVIIKSELPVARTMGNIPTIVNGLITVQAGNIIFNKQQKLALAGDAIKIGGYGAANMELLSGYRMKFSDLKVVLTEITTTTTSAVSNSTSVPVASRNGILDNVSSVSGIGINPAVADPTVASGAGAVSGAGTIVLSAAQTLESGITLTFSGAGQVATITGNIEILKAGTADLSLSFDVERVLSIA